MIIALSASLGFELETIMHIYWFLFVRKVITVPHGAYTLVLRFSLLWHVVILLDVQSFGFVTHFSYHRILSIFELTGLF